jgi:transcriptional antiterminator/mannitol/fructose-specific phosphotransferase system IIA component (Ntr-type)
MNSRSIRIIKQLCSGQTCRIADLASMLGISTRLIRYEIEEANSFLTREGFCTIECDRLGVSLPIPEQEKDHFQQWLAGLDVNDISLTAEERKTVMLVLLLSSPGYLTSQYFADMLGVSKSCIDKDLSLLKTQVQNDGLQFLCKPGSGDRLRGEERKIRAICLNTIEQSLSFADYLSNEDYNPEYVERQVQKCFCDAWFRPLTEVIHDLEQRLDKKLSYSSFRNLLLYLCVALTRISNKNFVTIEPENQVLLQATKEYKLAEEISEQIDHRFGVKIPVSEKCTFTVLLVGAKYSIPEPYMKEDWAEIQILTDRMIQAMSEKLSISFMEDEEMYTALQAHLGPMVFRLKNKVPALNPSLKQIKHTYENIFSALQSVIQSINSPLLAGIQEDDIAYLSLHFCASIERRERIFTISRVAIVCVHGVGTANLLKELVCSRFKSIRVVTTTTENDLTSIEMSDVDFVISSIPLAHCSSPWVKVNPILTDDDFCQIERMIAKYSSKSRPSNTSLNFFNEVVSTIEDQCVVDNMPLLIDSLIKCFEKAGISIKRSRVQPTLAQLLPPEKIKCRQVVSDWESAVRLAGSILLEAGDVTGDFVESIVKTVQSAGPYSVVSRGVALVHSEVGMGINNLAMSMITLQEPVPFHHPTNDPVKLILCLAPVDNSSHVSALEDFIEFLRGNDVDCICEETDPYILHEYLHRSDE